MVDFRDRKASRYLNPYYIGYEMMMYTLSSHNDLYDGLSKALALAKDYMQSNDIIIFKYKDDEYHSFVNKNDIDVDSVYVGELLNKLKVVVENRDFLDLKLNNESGIDTISFFPVILKEDKYVLAVTNRVLTGSIEDRAFNSIFIDTITVILENISSYERLKKDNKRDGLTDISNRKAFNERVKYLDASDEEYIFVLFDLFRLKYINDNYGHLFGDEYIMETAELLTKYFPEYKHIKNEDDEYRKVPTGSSVYRVGGDEFVLIVTDEDVDEIKAKLDQVVLEVEDMNLGISSHIDTGINYGIAVRKNHESADQLYLIADEVMSSSKAKMYQKLHIERRK